MSLCSARFRPRPTRLLTAVQLFAWIDLVLFLVLIGPTILLTLAKNTIDPSYRSLMTTTATPTRDIVLYNVDRPPSLTEHQVIQRIRQGCGRNYARNIPFIWAKARLILNKGMNQFSASLIATFFSSILFLIVVPASNWLGHVTPVLHLLLQLVSVITSMLGVNNLLSTELCLLEKILPSFRIQTGVAVFTLLINVTYKLYEISLIDAYIRLHIRSLLIEAEARAAAAKEISPDEQLQELIDQLTKGNKLDQHKIDKYRRAVADAAGEFENMRTSRGGGHDEEEDQGEEQEED